MLSLDMQQILTILKATTPTPNVAMALPRAAVPVFSVAGTKLVTTPPAVQPIIHPPEGALSTVIQTMPTTPTVQPFSANTTPSPAIDPLDLQSFSGDNISSILDELSSPCLYTSQLAPPLAPQMPAPQPAPPLAPQMPAPKPTPPLAPQMLAPPLTPQMPAPQPAPPLAPQMLAPPLTPQMPAPQPAPPLAPQMLAPPLTPQMPGPLPTPPIAPHLPAVQQRQLASPEKALVKVEGRNTDALRKLAIILARGCIFGDDVLIQSSPSGRGERPRCPTKKCWK